MMAFDEEPDDFYPDGDDGYCDKCGGDGWILTCCDDMCHGVGYCIHGDGMEMCACNTSAEPPANAPREWRWTPDRKQERERDADDGSTYGDPRDERDERLDRS